MLSLFLLLGIIYSFGFRDTVRAAPVSYSTQVDSTLTWNRPAPSPANNWRTFTSFLLNNVPAGYAVTSFVPASDGYYSIITSAGAGTISDPMLYIYKDAFDPANPTANFVVGNDDPDGSNRYSALLPGELYMTGGSTYYIVTTSFSTNVYGNVNFAIEGPYFDVAYSAGTGGSLTGSAQQYILAGQSGPTVEAIPDPGFYFISWSDGYPTALRTDTDVQGDIAAAASFADHFSLKYASDSNGTIAGTVDQTVTPFESGTEIEAVPNPGYHFVSWSDGYPTALRTDTNVAADVDATAAFEINSYELTYTAGANGTLSGDLDQTVTHGSDATAVEAIADTGYHFVKWSDDVLTALRTDAAITSDLDVTAGFEVNIYDVTFEAQGGTPVAAITAPYNTLISAPAEPTMTGYTFAGWYREAECTTVWDFAADTVTDNTTLYADWTINSYTVTFQDWDGTVLDTQMIIYGDDAAAPEAPSRSGYTFETWSVPFTDVADNTIVEAVYTMNPTPTPTETPSPTPTSIPTAAPTTAPLGMIKTGETDNTVLIQTGIVLLIAFGAVATVYVIRRKKMQD